jgi:hypothetical protein
MRKIISLLVLVLLFSCNSENVPDCFQNSGAIIDKEFEVSDFTVITVFPRVELILSDGPIQKVTVQTGTYLLDDIELRVEDGRLNIYNNNVCNFTRDYGVTKVFVTAPNITEIRNASERTVRSQGVLNYESLSLVSEDFNQEGDVNTNGDFDLELNCNALIVDVNNLSSVFLSGEADDLVLRYYSGDARFEGRNLIAQRVDIFQRSSNDMIINVQQSIIGEIRGVGDVVLVSTPSVIDVQQFYTGQLIIE